MPVMAMGMPVSADVKIDARTIPAVAIVTVVPVVPMGPAAVPMTAMAPTAAAMPNILHLCVFACSRGQATGSVAKGCGRSGD